MGNNTLEKKNGYMKAKRNRNFSEDDSIDNL